MVRDPRAKSGNVRGASRMFSRAGDEGSLGPQLLTVFPEASVGMCDSFIGGWALALPSAHRLVQAPGTGWGGPAWPDLSARAAGSL